MSGIQKFFKTKNPTSIETAFLRQCKENESVEHEIAATNEKKILENKIELLEIENRDLKKKYDGLKSKHVGLLQVLFKLEQKNQDLERKTQCEKSVSKIALLDDNQPSKSEQCSEFLTHLVDLDFSLNSFVFSPFVVTNFRLLRT